jgi:hypothetical protein
MTLIIVAGSWILFAILVAILARFLAVKYAESRGWSALTMPMSYHVWFVTIYLAVIQFTWVGLYFTFLK